MVLTAAVVKAYAPIAKHEAQKIFGEDKLVFCDDFAEAIAQVEVIRVCCISV
ncbi:MAG: hypothetical protein F6K21_16915 [Symploca sp. SIO2D2]|nr:hypothetical protein [Symploca sp. SIO2D2]